MQPQVALAGFGPHLHERHARVTLQQRGIVGLPHAQASWVEMDVENELSVLRNPRKHCRLPPATDRERDAKTSRVTRNGRPAT